MRLYPSYRAIQYAVDAHLLEAQYWRLQADAEKAAGVEQVFDTPGKHQWNDGHAVLCLLRVYPSTNGANDG